MDVSDVHDNWSEVESDVSDASLKYSEESDSIDQEGPCTFPPFNRRTCVNYKIAQF